MLQIQVDGVYSGCCKRALYHQNKESTVDLHPSPSLHIIIPPATPSTSSEGAEIFLVYHYMLPSPASNSPIYRPSQQSWSVRVVDLGGTYFQYFELARTVLFQSVSLSTFFTWSRTPR
jgi:hypothetical protein